MRSNVRCVLAIVAATVCSMAVAARAEEPLVFISTFTAAKDGGAIRAFRLDRAGGKLKEIARTPEVENCYFFTLSPDRKCLYAIHALDFEKADSQVAAYAIDGATGRLKLLNRQSTRGATACYLHVDSTARTLLVANYTSGSVASLPVKQDGSLGEVVSLMQHAGRGADPERQEGPHAHSILTSPDNRFAMAADLGIDEVMVYQLNAAASTLRPHEKPSGSLPRGAGPRHMVFSPAGKHLYAINELGGSVTVFDYDPQTAALVERQTISTLPRDFKGTNLCADVKITPDGRCLYATNRGHDSLAAYRIGPDGRLTLIAIEPSMGKEAQNLAITADGRLLLCANLAGNNLAIFRINSETVRLTSLGDPISVPSPSCIRIVEGKD
ncbi:MAG: lactonase family protein [Planctomycetota bacterium]|nr:lactonase family protein [Planctomycetota bacterium]